VAWYPRAVDLNHKVIQKEVEENVYANQKNFV
jgi:hypothetical protein